jgi:hypothetical protein
MYVYSIDLLTLLILKGPIHEIFYLGCFSSKDLPSPPIHALKPLQIGFEFAKIFKFETYYGAAPPPPLPSPENNTPDKPPWTGF